MQEIVLIILMAVAIALVAVILLQKSEGGAAGLTGGASSGAFMSVRGTANFLTRATTILAVFFMGLCLFLAVLAARGKDEASSIMENAQPPAGSLPAGSPPAGSAPSTPAAPATPATPSVPLE